MKNKARDDAQDYCPWCGELVQWLRDWCGNQCCYRYLTCPKCGAKFLALDGGLVTEGKRAALDGEDSDE